MDEKQREIFKLLVFILIFTLAIILATFMIYEIINTNNLKKEKCLSLNGLIPLDKDRDICLVKKNGGYEPFRFYRIGKDYILIKE